MEELIQLVAQKTGLPQDKARVAVDAVLNYLKGKVPASVAPIIDSAAKGQSAGMGDLEKGLGGMFGKK